MKIITKTRLMLLATVATAALVQPAMALDAQAFIDRVVASYGELGYVITPGAVSGDDTSVTVKGVKIDVKGANSPLSIDSDLTFNNVTEGDDGSFTAESLTMPDVEYDINETVPGHISLKNIALDGFYVPAAGAPAFLTSLQLFQSISAGPLVVTRKGVEVVSIESIAAENTFNPEQGSAALVDVASTFDLEGFKADLSSVGEDDKAAGDVIKALNLTKVSGNINESMTWSVADGHVVLDSFLVNLDDKGSLELALDVTGFTPAVMDAIFKSQSNAATMTPEQLEQANGLLGMQVMQAVSITSASVRYDDASLAGSLLDYFAAQSGADRAGFVEGLKQMVPAMLAGVAIPELDAIVVPAVNAFLDDPKNIEVSIAADAPTSLLTLMGAAANPASLIKLLNFSVEANSTDESAD